MAAVAFSAAVIIQKFHMQGKEDAREGILESVKEEKTITAEYLLSYILSLFAFDNQVLSFCFDGVEFMKFKSIFIGFSKKSPYFDKNLLLYIANKKVSERH